MSVRLLSIVTLAAAVAGCSTAQTKAERHMKAGDQFVVQGRNYAALIEYLNAIKQTPASSVAYRKLGQAHLAAGDAGAAYRSFTRAVDLDPADNEPRLEAARLLLRANMNDLAQVRADQVLEREPDNLDAQIIAARALARLRRTDEAIARLSLVTDTKRQAPAFLAVAEIKDHAGDVAGAERAFAQAIRGLESVLTDPRCQGAKGQAIRYELGLLYEVEAQWEKAAHTFQSIPAFHDVPQRLASLKARSPQTSEFRLAS